MKMKKHQTGAPDKAAPPKPAKSRKVLMEVISVRIPDAYTDSQSAADIFLRDGGFVSVSRTGGSVEAAGPKPESGTMIVVEYEPAKAGYSPFRMVRIRGGRPENLDTGHIHLIMPGSMGQVELSARGEEVVEWEMQAKLAGITEIPVTGSFNVRSDADTEKLRKVNSLDPKNGSTRSSDPLRAGHIETSLPSTATAMIQYTVDRMAAPPEKSELASLAARINVPPKRFQAVAPSRLEEAMALASEIKTPVPQASLPPQPQASPQPSPQPQAPPPVIEKQPVVVEPPPPQPLEEQQAKWRTNPRLIAFMQEHCNGSDKMAVLAEVLDVYIKRTERSIAMAAAELDETTVFLHSILSVLKLDPALRPLLDKAPNDPERIGITELNVLVRFPQTAQQQAWERSSDGKDRAQLNRAEIVSKLYELGKPYFQRRKYGSVWAR